MLKRILPLLIVIGLAGCSSTPAATSAPTTQATQPAGSPTAAAALPTSAPAPTEEPYPETAEAVVTAFMDEVLADPQGTDPAKYFDGPLQQRVERGESIASLIGVQNLPESYTIEPPTPNNTEQSAFVVVTLNFAQPEQRLFALTFSVGRWRIISVKPLL